MKHHNKVERTQKDTPGWCWCTSTNFILQILILKHQIFQISYSHKLYKSFVKNYFSPDILQNHQNICKTARKVEILDCLKLEDICIQTIIPSQNTAFRYTLALASGILLNIWLTSFLCREIFKFPCDTFLFAPFLEFVFLL